MEDGGRTITLHVAASLLTQRGLLDGLSTRNLLLLYNFYRDKIEAAASAKYDRFYCDGSDLVVVASDLE